MAGASIILLALTAATGAVAAVARVAGGSAERDGAALVVGGSAAAAAVWLATGRPDSVLAFAAVDLALFSGFMAVGWRARRGWPLAAAASLGVAMAIHIIRIASPATTPRTYLVALAIPHLGVVMLLATATAEVLRLQKHAKRLFS